MNEIETAGHVSMWSNLIAVLLGFLFLCVVGTLVQAIAKEYRRGLNRLSLQSVLRQWWQQ